MGPSLEKILPTDTHIENSHNPCTRAKVAAKHPGAQPMPEGENRAIQSAVLVLVFYIWRRWKVNKQDGYLASFGISLILYVN